MLQKTNCENCNAEFEADIQICCTSASADCGCLGLPVNGPIVCGEKCYYQLLSKIRNSNRRMSYSELEVRVIEWAAEKGILAKGNPMAQWEKTHEEVLELIAAIVNNDKDEIVDALGDILVTIIIQAELQGLRLEECLESAYNVISKRTGKMVNGQFIKD